MGQFCSLTDSLYDLQKDEKVDLWASRTSSSEERVAEKLQHLARNQMSRDFRIYDLDIYGDGKLTENLRTYYQLCKDTKDLLVTTSNFAVWRASKKTNGSAKVIPAIPSNYGEDARVFFFDDNINLHLGGSSEVDGICNLRDIGTGEFVDFSVGRNGFQCCRAFRHTLIHHSSQYRNVLIQANILDAMANADYFMEIILKFAEPGEKLIVYVDVNGTLVWDDTMAGKGTPEVLLSTMFRFAEVRPKAGKPTDGVEFPWLGLPPVKIKTPQALKQVVLTLSRNEAEYAAFWSVETCRRFLKELSAVADIAWQMEQGATSLEEFFSVYEGYLNVLRKHATVEGITRSWFTVYEALRLGGHTVVLNSFGVDSRRVVLQSVKDERQVLQITVNYQMWCDRDRDAWDRQFGGSTSPSGGEKAG